MLAVGSWVGGAVLAVGSWVGGGVAMVLSPIISLFFSLSLSTEMPSQGAVKTKTTSTALI